jgi:hypothetical protein
VDDSETVWVEREYVGHGFRDDDLSRLKTERVVFDECDFRAASTSPNPSTHVDRVPGKPKKFATYTPAQVEQVLRSIREDRNRHAWHLAPERAAPRRDRWVAVDQRRP